MRLSPQNVFHHTEQTDDRDTPIVPRIRMGFAVGAGVGGWGDGGGVNGVTR